MDSRTAPLLFSNTTPLSSKTPRSAPMHWLILSARRFSEALWLSLRVETRSAPLALAAVNGARWHGAQGRGCSGGLSHCDVASSRGCDPARSRARLPRKLRVFIRCKPVVGGAGQSRHRGDCSGWTVQDLDTGHGPWRRRRRQRRSRPRRPREQGPREQPLQGGTSRQLGGGELGPTVPADFSLSHSLDPAERVGSPPALLARDAPPIGRRRIGGEAGWPLPPVSRLGLTVSGHAPWAMCQVPHVPCPRPGCPTLRPPPPWPRRRRCAGSAARCTPAAATSLETRAPGRGCLPAATACP